MLEKNHPECSSTSGVLGILLAREVRACRGKKTQGLTGQAGELDFYTLALGKMLKKQAKKSKKKVQALETLHCLGAHTIRCLKLIYTGVGIPFVGFY